MLDRVLHVIECGVCQADASQNIVPLAHVQFYGGSRHCKPSSGGGWYDDVGEQSRETAVAHAALVGLVNYCEIEDPEPESHRVFKPRAQLEVLRILRGIKDARPGSQQ